MQFDVASLRRSFSVESVYVELYVEFSVNHRSTVRPTTRHEKGWVQILTKITKPIKPQTCRAAESQGQTQSTTSRAKPGIVESTAGRLLGRSNSRLNDFVEDVEERYHYQQHQKHDEHLWPSRNRLERYWVHN